MVYQINDILFLLMLIVGLIIVYYKIFYSCDFIGPFTKYYSSFNRKSSINNYIKEVSKPPVDFKKNMFFESLYFITILIVLSLIATKTIFFVAVASGSMRPLLDTNDLVLIQNFEHSYKPGDVIFFMNPDTNIPFTHRIAKFTSKGKIRTVGDAIGTMDYWELEEKDIHGKVVLFGGKPIVIPKYGELFLVNSGKENVGPFKNLNDYVLFFQVVKAYGYVIIVFSLLLYIILTVKQKK
jgi:signal peptidase I